MAKCIICHMEIDTKEDSYDQCPNGHKIHKECLIGWLSNSHSCPLCNAPYSKEIIAKYDKILKKTEKQKMEALKEQREKENLETIKEIGKKMLFLKLIDVAEKKIANQDYIAALNLIDEFKNKYEDYKSKEIMFLRGKINFLRGRYDMAVNHLFRLVKKDFEYPEAFLYLGKAYQALGLNDKAKWAFERVK